MEDGTAARAIVTRAVSCPRWAPDGRSLAFLSGDRIYVCDADGRNVRRIVPAGVDSVYSLSWAPSGSTLYFHGTAAGVYDIYRMDPSTTSSSVTNMTDDVTPDAYPDVSPDGRLLAWARSDGDYEIVIRAPYGSGTPAKLTSNTVSDLWPRWSPDGQYIAFYRENVATGRDIYVFDLLRHSEQRLTNTADADSYPDWTCDGQYVLFTRGSDLYRTLPTGSPGSEELVATGWGTRVDSSAGDRGPWRVVIGPLGSDWGGANPPLWSNRPLALVGLDDRGLSTAVTCILISPQSSGVIDPVPDTGDRVVVARVSGTSGVNQVWEDNGPRLPVTKIIVEQSDGAYAGSILLVFGAETGRLSSVIPVHEQPWTSGAGQGGVRAELKGNRLLLHAPATAVYVPQPGGGAQNLAPGGATVVVLNGATGRPLGVR